MQRKVRSDRLPDTNDFQQAESHVALVKRKMIKLLPFFCLHLCVGMGVGVHREQCGECSGNSGGTAPEA